MQRLCTKAEHFKTLQLHQSPDSWRRRRKMMLYMFTNLHWENKRLTMFVFFCFWRTVYFHLYLFRSENSLPFQVLKPAYFTRLRLQMFFFFFKYRFDSMMGSFESAGQTHFILRLFYWTVISADKSRFIWDIVAVCKQPLSSFTDVNTFRGAAFPSHTHTNKAQCHQPQQWYYVANRGGVVCPGV